MRCSMAWPGGRHQTMNRNGRAAMPSGRSISSRGQGPADYSEYLNSGIAFNSSLVALNTAWSGYQGLAFEVEAAGAVVAAPVVVEGAVLEDVLAVPAPDVLLAPV